MQAEKHAIPLDRSITTIAAAKNIIGVVAIVSAVLGHAATVQPQQLLRLAHVLAYGICGAMLLIAGRRDQRARLLGTGVLLVGSLIADQLVRVHPAEGWPVTAAEQAMALQVDAFLPYFLWRFVREFPHLTDVLGSDRLLAWAIRVSLGIGVVLFAANAALAFGAAAYPTVAGWLMPLSRWPRREIYWPLQLTLSLVALITLLVRIRHGTVDERRRGSLLVAGIVGGTGPTLCWALLRAMSPTFAALLPLRRAGWVLYPTLLAMPFAIAYAVLVGRALDARLVVRRALQYALARYSVMALAALPVGLLLLSTYRRRDERVAQLVSAPGQIALVMLSLIGLFAMRRRGEVLRSIDRRFFREQYDAAHTLAQLVERCRGVADARELSHVLRTEIDRALHLHAVHVLFLNSLAHAFVASEGHVRPLDVDSPLAELLERSDGALRVDLERPSSGSRAFPEEEQRWILDAGARLLLPLRDRVRRLIGVVVLGEKRSELPFSREDVDLLRGVATAADMAIVYRNLQPPEADVDAGVPDSTVHAAAECVRCHAVQPAGDLTCARCGGETMESHLPQLVAGKFLIDQRIGAGGMGVVYRGMDVHLGRLVAIKTLPFLLPGEAIRLQREARTMAAISHPNLALIFGAEVWQGQPLLVFEYLAGGTLDDRLRRGPLGVRATIALGLAMASVVDAIHKAGVLHRDIKPSNIGFTGDRVPKLLDFGLARLMTSIASEREVAARAVEGAASTANAAGAASAGSIVSTAGRGGVVQLGGLSRTESLIQGTPLYMSPEALLGARPDRSFDLWGLGVVLYEAMTGRHPSTDGVTRTPRPSTPPVGSMTAPQEELPPAAVEFFRQVLSERREARPSSAEDLAERLRRLAAADPSPSRVDEA